MPDALADIPLGVDCAVMRESTFQDFDETGSTRRAAPVATVTDPAIASAMCDGIIDLIAIFFNVSGRQLRSPQRTSRPVSRVRQIGMYVAHVTLGMKMTAVGTGFGRDKSTVVHACHTIEDMRDDEDFDVIVSRVERLISVAFSLDHHAVRVDD